MRLLVLAAVAALLVPATADAAIVTFKFQVDATYSSGPLASVTGIFAGSYDDAADQAHVPLSLTGSTFPIRSGTPEFSYQASTGFLSFGTTTMPGGYDIQSGFGFGVTTPGSPFGNGAAYALVTPVTYVYGRSTPNPSISAKLTSLAAPGAPAPLLGMGLLPLLAAAGALGMTRRKVTLGAHPTPLPA